MLNQLTETYKNVVTFIKTSYLQYHKEHIVNEYISLGKEFADYIDETDDTTLTPEFIAWQDLEQQYQKLGYQTISFEQFNKVDDLSSLIAKPKQNDVLHAQLFKAHYITDKKRPMEYRTEIFYSNLN